MAFLSSNNILKTELSIAHEGYLNDESFLFFCMNWNNPYPQPYTTNKDELQHQFSAWINNLTRDTNSCFFVFNGDVGDIYVTPGGYTIPGLLSKFITTYLANRIGEDQLEWMNKKDERQISFMKQLLQHISIANFNNNIFDLISIPAVANAGIIKGDSNPFTSKSSSLQTIRNTLSCLAIPKAYKNLIINKMKSAWLAVNSKNKFPAWARNEDSNKITDWLKQQNLFKSPSTYILSQYTNHDYIKLVTLHFDIQFLFFQDRAELQLKSMRNSWSQAKTREKNQSKVQLNFILPPNIKSILKEVCDTTGVSRNDFVEMAIKNEYKRFQDATKKGS